jgi:flagellar biosynthesis GTPase FlhF
MQTKAYFASSVPAALEVARRELGENALLVSSKPTSPQARKFGPLEVTFAWDPKEAAARNPAANPVGPATVVPGALPERLAEAGFSRETAGEIATVAELARRIPVAPFTEMKPGENRTLAFIGPPGRGKTTSLVKIAVNLGLARRVPVRIYCAGAHAIGAQEQAARFAAILGAPFQACESLASLNLALSGEEWKGLVLIDTPGISPADRNEFSELKDFFTARPEIEKHLVLRADASSADSLHMMSRFSGLTPSRLLFTGMDEAVRMGPAIEALIRGGIPATFTGTGQQIPEDLEEVSADKLARAVWTATVPVPAAAAHFAPAHFAQTAAA